MKVLRYSLSGDFLFKTHKRTEKCLALYIFWITFALALRRGPVAQLDRATAF